MTIENFYSNGFTLHGELPSVELKESASGGLDFFVDGHEIPGVIQFTIDRSRPFPSVYLQIGMVSLTLPDGYSLDDGGGSGDDRSDD